MTSLIGLDLVGRQVVVAGAGRVGTRRARGLAAEGAHVVLVDPHPSDAARELATAPPGGRVELRERGVTEARRRPGVARRRGDREPRRRRRRGPLVRGTAHLVHLRRDRDRAHRGDQPPPRPGGGGRLRREPDPRRAASVRDAVALLLSSGRVDLRRRRAGAGRVVLVGGGPGDPRLVTLAGLEALAAADVVVTDRLGATALLDRLPDDVEVVDVGKDPRHHPVPQGEINRLLVDRARQGFTVVRLKGGDPFVYGRGGEEVHACREAGVDVTVVPGISSALAVPLLAGIPVTQRGVSSSVHVSSGHVGADPGALAALAAGSTLVLLMAVASLPEICEAAVAPGSTPTCLSRSSRTARRLGSGSPTRRCRPWPKRLPRGACGRRPWS